MFRYGNTNANAIKLKLFPSSLAGEAKIWFSELSPSVISTWEEMRQAFVSRFFPPSMFDRLMGEVRGFTQQHHESLVDAWLHEPTQAILDAGGIFLNKTPNEAHQLLEDRVLLKLGWKTKPLRKTVAFVEGEENSTLLEKMEALTTRNDSQFKEIRGDMKEMRYGCNKCGGPHPSSDCHDKPMGGPKEEEANYASGGYRGNYYGRNSSNWRDHRENQNSTPREENPPIPRLPKKKPDESEFEKSMKEFVIAQKTANDFFKNQFYNLKTKVEQGQKNHQAAIQDLETKFGRISDHQSSRPMGIPNYGKFLKDLVSNKSKIEQISAAFLTEECLTILQNKIPPKLGDPKSFLIPFKLANSVEYLALADLGASINLMSYSLYAALYGTTLKPTRTSIRLANHTYQYPMGVAENMLVQVGKFVFLVDFVILQIEEDDRVPLILGIPCLHTADAIIRHSHVIDDTCFRMDVIDDITEDELNALLDDSKPFINTSEKISETPLDKEFDEFTQRMFKRMKSKTILRSYHPEEELRINKSIQDPPTDLKMKPLPKHLEYAYLEEKSLLPVVISALLEQNEKERLVSVLKNHKEAFSWETSDIPRISPSF
ncbi:reverse transcriptase domain-containing protein [Tanacetum coccineum]|uniref:Reverse transcriptase domain-containing protein n=1 Tax=Tanacetum coccineum TaxID=301880 RepID=A0ABQ5AMD0_9ASTR